MRCRTVDDIAREALRIIDEESSVHPEPHAEFFFRGESKNHKSDYDDEPLGTAFQSLLDRKGIVEYERELYQEAMRLNVALFVDLCLFKIVKANMCVGEEKFWSRIAKGGFNEKFNNYVA